MILIDCIYLNSPGGKTILKILLDRIPVNEIKNFHFIIDSRSDAEILDKLKKANYRIIKNSELKRRSYYLLNKDKIEKCICLANIPPPVKLNCDVIIYFHDELLLNPVLSLSFFKSCNLIIKKSYIKMINNSGYNWVVQTNLMRKKLNEALEIKNENIDVIPIFRDFSTTKSFDKISNSFLYVCSNSPHKNLKRLINAFNRIKI